MKRGRSLFYLLSALSFSRRQGGVSCRHTEQESEKEEREKARERDEHKAIIDQLLSFLKKEGDGGLGGLRRCEKISSTFHSHENSTDLSFVRRMNDKPR